MEDLPNQVRVLDPVTPGQDHKVARHRGQAGQWVGLDEVRAILPQTEVDPGQVAAPEGLEHDLGRVIGS